MLSSSALFENLREATQCTPAYAALFQAFIDGFQPRSYSQRFCHVLPHWEQKKSVGTASVLSAYSLPLTSWRRGNLPRMRDMGIGLPGQTWDQDVKP